MAKWKLCRQLCGKEEYTLLEGEEVTVGRSVNSTICLSSLVVSRNHCVLNVQRDKIYITDLKSANGTYVGIVKIPPNTPYILKNSDVIGFGWTKGPDYAQINDQDKFVFKLTRDSISSRIIYQSDTELEDVESKVSIINGVNEISPQKPQSPILCAENQNITSNPDLKRNLDIPCEKKESVIDTVDERPQEIRTKSPILSLKNQEKEIETTLKPDLKRKLETNIKKELPDKTNIVVIDDVINILSDSDNEVKQTVAKKPKLEFLNDEIKIKEEIKTEKDNIQFETFNVKQEYLGYDDDEPIKIDSDSDSESEQWLLRLSQSSPGKPFSKITREKKVETKREEFSYSQIDDFLSDDNDEIFDNLITIPPVPHHQVSEVNKVVGGKHNVNFIDRAQACVNAIEGYLDDIISLEGSMETASSLVVATSATTSDEVDSIRNNHMNKLDEKSKKIQMIDALEMPKKKTSFERKSKSIKNTKHSSKKHISNSQKEERKKKLKDIANKEKTDTEHLSSKHSSSKQDKVLNNVKVTSSNRGAFLIDAAQGVVKPEKRKDSPKTNKKSSEMSPAHTKAVKSNEDVENKKKRTEKAERKEHDSAKEKGKQKISQNSSKLKKSNSQQSRVPLKNLKPLTESEESFSGKPFSKVEPIHVKKPKKKVRFSDAAPTVRLFEIEEGNMMKKTSLVRTTLVDKRPIPVFSLEKITLMKILRWNPHWLEEQINNNDPPPILGHSNPPMTIFHSFNNHSQYVSLVGDLLLMEIWECLTQGFMRIRNQNVDLQLRIDSMPPVPTQDRCYELFNFSVNLSLPSAEARNVPRLGEIMLITFGPEESRNRRFFFVHNVRSLPSPPNNVNSFFTISLQACYTDKMKYLKQGELLTGRRLAYINKELSLFEAMEQLAGSPLSDIILRPQPKHFPNKGQNTVVNTHFPWTRILNPSQQEAVNASVSAALGDKPCIQMVQGPPGTGKSSVICSIVMSYFYDAQGKRQQNRGKILICATSNAAVDDLVLRLLDIRQKLPKEERFRMVRVGRAEAMHPRAYEVSSQQLAIRDARHQRVDTVLPGLSEEILHLEAKINMWKVQAQDAKDSVRVAYCQGRVAQLAQRITLLRGGVGCDDIRPDQLAQVERRIIEGAHIIVTTLASAHNRKMRGLIGRIALCVVDEAGQAIEPETLIPLTLHVTRLTLIGDPQQLPGYICSQRAKKHGLGESLFSRLSSSTEHWSEGSPVLLLNQQYRMHSEIADYPNRAFYAGRIQTVTQLRPDLCLPPYAIVSISSGDKGQVVSGANEMEAWGVSRLVVALTGELRARGLSLAVITPYNAHKDLIKKNLRMLLDPADTFVEVNTVDSFQGQERDVVVVSLARSQGVGFLTDTGRMNVMLTRARHALLVCLNPHAMLKNHQWRTLVDDAQQRNLLKVLPNKMCQPTTPAQLHNDDILKYITSKNLSRYK